MSVSSCYDGTMQVESEILEMIREKLERKDVVTIRQLITEKLGSGPHIYDVMYKHDIRPTGYTIRMVTGQKKQSYYRADFEMYLKRLEHYKDARGGVEECIMRVLDAKTAALRAIASRPQLRDELYALLKEYDELYVEAKKRVDAREAARAALIKEEQEYARLRSAI